MATNARTDRATIARDKIQRHVEDNIRMHTDPLLLAERTACLEAMAHKHSCKDCRSFVKVKWQGFCQLKNMKLVKAENVCGHHTLSI